MYIKCVILCLFNALSRRVGAIQISILNMASMLCIVDSEPSLHSQKIVFCEPSLHSQKIVFCHFTFFREANTCIQSLLSIIFYCFGGG